MEKLFNNTAAAFNNLDGDGVEAACARAGLSAADTAIVAPLLANIVSAYETVENSYDDDEPLDYDGVLESLGVTGNEKAVALKLICDDLGGF